MKTQLLTAICFLQYFVASAQETYTFEASTATYEELSGSTSLNNGQIWDDPAFTIPLGFDFQVADMVFDTVYIVDWSAGGVLASSPDDSGSSPLFVPIGQDLIDPGYWQGTSQSTISYVTEGNAGNRILKIEWKPAGFVGDGSPNTDYVHFQVWLYEDTNRIEYRYGPNEINNPEESFEGDAGPRVAFMIKMQLDVIELEENGYFLSGNPTDPSIQETDDVDDVNEEGLDGMIPNGTVYAFTPETLAVADAAKHAFSLYPNPAKDKVTIASDFELLQLKIYSSNGRYTQTYKDPQNTVDVSSLSSGVYFVEVVSESGKATRKLLIH